MPSSPCRLPCPMFHVVTVLTVLWAVGCWIGETPAPRLPVIDAGAWQGGEGTSTCDCEGARDAGQPQGRKGLRRRAYRFTRMVIEEPYLLAAALNEKWKADLEDHVLNVVFYIEEVDPSYTGYVARRIEVKAGSGWRTPSDLFLPEGGEVESYCHLEGTGSRLVLEPNRLTGNLCSMMTVEVGNLAFHAGPLGAPVNCAPEMEPRHAIPLKQVQANFVFNEDCSRLVRGNLSACLEKRAVEKLCICLTDTGTCTVEDPAAPAPDEPGGTPAYCQHCGPGSWVPLASLLNIPPGENDDLPACDPPIGNGGYKVSGVFEADDITELFDRNECR